MPFSRILLDLVGRKTSGQKGADSIKCGQVQAMPFVINTSNRLSSVQLCMVSHSSGKRPGNPSSFRQFPEAVGQKTKRTVNKILKMENTWLEVSSCVCVLPTGLCRVVLSRPREDPGDAKLP